VAPFVAARFTGFFSRGRRRTTDDIRISPAPALGIRYTAELRSNVGRWIAPHTGRRRGSSRRGRRCRRRTSLRST